MIDSNFLENICRKIGWKATLALAVNYSEQRVYVPLLFDSQHHLSASLGERGFRDLVAAHGGETIYVPACSDAQRIGLTKPAFRLKRAGFTNWNIGRFLGVSERQVRNLVNDAAPLGQDEHVPPLPPVVRRLLSGGFE